MQLKPIKIECKPRSTCYTAVLTSTSFSFLLFSLSVSAVLLWWIHTISIHHWCTGGSYHRNRFGNEKFQVPVWDWWKKTGEQFGDVDETLLRKSSRGGKFRELTVSPYTRALSPSWTRAILIQLLLQTVKIRWHKHYRAPSFENLPQSVKKSILGSTKSTGHIALAPFFDVT